MKKIITLLTIMTAFSSILTAEDFGSHGAFKADDYTLEEMLRYAIEDEYAALAEYTALMEEFGVDRPYSNIAESEKRHITFLEILYEEHGLEIPEVDTDSHLIIPESLEEAAKIGVEAEINNIAMYEKFLLEDLPEDVREVFEELQAGSENHLQAFQRQVERSGSGSGGRHGD